MFNFAYLSKIAKSFWLRSKKGKTQKKPVRNRGLTVFDICHLGLN